MKQEFDDIYVSEAVDAGEYDYEGDMAKTQLVTIADAAEELHDMLKDDENLPEWCQNKITKAMDYLDTVRDYMIAKDTDEEPGDENPNEAVVNEGNMASAAKELETYARKSGGIDKNDFIKAAMMMKRNQKKQLDKFVDELDTEPREKIQSVMQKHIKEAYSEPQGQAKRMMSPLQKMRMDKEKKDRDRDGKLKPGVVRRGKSTMNRLRDIQNKSNVMALKSSKEQVEEGAMKRIAQAQGGTKPDRSDAAANKGGLQTFKKKPTNEKLKVSDGMGAWIDDFKQSDAPQFKGKDAKERRDMAIAAYLSAKDGGKNEDV